MYVQWFVNNMFHNILFKKNAEQDVNVSATSLLTQPQRFCFINKHLLILKQ